ncbi:carbon-nitrogen hydrolase family protein [Rufibacter sediminis]|uniref:Carbon-nitrogen hydrolase family protein n=1 Tax=Rufibacter sediminis TaxID=2762756 RepID=A0ABR6VYS5_9BACT|nr:carbon-nitrogen hydrolase family protein [Rufibacter sediminis]MBC3542309.1 carbon-nitrogen hydrolase family protein [Rufibacter sediminis]
MKISIAQIKPIKGDISANINKHKQMISLASSLKASAIFFPELSVTGYEPRLAEELATDEYDQRFDDFQQISDTSNITIGLGVPTNSDTGIRITMVIFQPGRARQMYSKQQLHADELPFFAPGEKQAIITVDQTKIAPAICYESLQPAHADAAAKMGAEIYLASVAKSQNGVNKAMVHYPEVAKEHAMPVLMANCVGACDDFVSVGQSSVWTNQGVLLAQLDNENEGLLVFDTETEEVTLQAV